MHSAKTIFIVNCNAISTNYSQPVIEALVGLGYSAKIFNYSDFQDSILQFVPDFIIAYLPGNKNLDLQYCHSLVKSIEVPIFVISSLDDVESRIQAFNIGIEDYLVSPVSPKVIAVRVRNILNCRFRSLVM